MNQNVPDPSIGGSMPNPALTPSAFAFVGSPTTPGTLAAFTPPAPSPGNTPGMQRKQRLFGLLPAAAGSSHIIVLREPPKGNHKPEDVGKTKGALRRAQMVARAKESALAAAAAADSTMASEPYRKALLDARDANDAVAALTRQLAEIEAALAKRPVRVAQQIVHEPAEVADAIASHPSAYVCLHEGCRGRSWEDEASMRRDHPTDAEMRRREAAHVFVVLCDAPLDPSDPEGERVGYVAPVGRDGTTIARAVATAEADQPVSADEVKELRGKLAAMEAMVSEMLAGKRK